MLWVPSRLAQCSLNLQQLSVTTHFAINPITNGGGGFDPEQLCGFRDPLKVKYIEMFYDDFSYLSILPWTPLKSSDNWKTSMLEGSKTPLNLYVEI